MASPKTLKILFAIHPKMDILDFTGPLEIFFHASHTPSSQKVFHSTITASTPSITTNQNCTINRHISMEDAYSTLPEYDILVIPGGGSAEVLEGQTEPLGLIKKFVEIGKHEEEKGGDRKKWLLSICTGSVILAEAGVLNGKKATTHPFFYEKLGEVARKYGDTKVLQERFVVNERDEGVRILTSGGVSAGLDAALWLVGEIVGEECKGRVGVMVQYRWREGIIL